MFLEPKDIPGVTLENIDEILDLLESNCDVLCYKNINQGTSFQRFSVDILAQSLCRVCSRNNHHIKNSLAFIKWMDSVSAINDSKAIKHSSTASSSAPSKLKLTLLNY